MTKVLLTGGSGFIAAHILEKLLHRGHKVVTTVRSEDKAQKIRDAYPNVGKDDLQVVIVPDIAKPDAFDEVIKIPGLEAVLHTASPFHFNWTDPQTELIDPALIGTTSILQATARSAPSVKRIVVTSSFAAIMVESRIKDPTMVFDESVWNPVTIDNIHDSKPTAYRASKTLAEQAAWAFVQDLSNGAKFDLVTVNPPLVLGPVNHHLASLDAINTSNARIADAVSGKWKKSGVSDTGVVFGWVDVRDLAEAHIRALELPEAGGKRLLTASDRFFANRDIYDIVKANFSEYADKLPAEELKGGELPPENEIYKVDKSVTDKLLGIKWTPLEQTVIDTVNSLKSFT